MILSYAMLIKLWEALPWTDYAFDTCHSFIYNTHTEFLSKHKYYKRFYRKLYLEFSTKGNQKKKFPIVCVPKTIFTLKFL